MTRIIGGTAGGRRLRTPTGHLTRPTSDRVREALFSALESALGSLGGLRFLDLYAGSGAVGLEAASRGAGPVTLVEQDRRTATLIRGNAAALRLAGVDVVAGSVRRYLDRGPGPAYDAVFLDPPYDLAGAAVTGDLRALAGGWLAQEALVVVERSTHSGPVEWPDGYAPARTRTYGETSLLFASWTGGAPESLLYGHDDRPARPFVQEPPCAEPPVPGPSTR